jgi:uncharacterized integral membrane protein
MLRPAEPPPSPPERPIGDLVHELVEEGKAYARAEVDLAKTIAIAKGKALAFPAGLIVAALFIIMASINALVVGVVLALATLIGPLAAGVLGLIIFLAVGGGLAWWGIEAARRAL